MATDTSRAVVAAAEELAGAGALDAGVLRLSTGVVVRAVGVPRAVFLRIMRKFEEPRPPVEVDPDKGRAEENLSNPDYLRALQAYRLQLAQAINDASLLLGVEIVSTPDGFPGPDDAGWLAERDLAGISSGDSAAARKLDWLTAKAARTDLDYLSIMRAVGRATGTPEADVQEAVKRV